jgi:hypothetical protein
MKKQSNDLDKYADILEGEFLEEAESLKEVSDDQWKSMGFPVGLANKIKAAVKEPVKRVPVP